MKATVLFLVLVFATFSSGPAHTQRPTSAVVAVASSQNQSPAGSAEMLPAFARAQAGASSGEALPAPPPNFAYEPGGRRDPFVSLVNRGSDTGSALTARSRPEGVGGVLVEEIVVRGIVQSRDGWIAMIGSPSGRAYSIRPGDRVMDGSVQSITDHAVVFLQDVNDPLSLEKQREVRKYLRGEVK